MEGAQRIWTPVDEEFHPVKAGIMCARGELRQGQPLAQPHRRPRRQLDRFQFEDFRRRRPVRLHIRHPQVRQQSLRHRGMVDEVTRDGDDRPDGNRRRRDLNPAQRNRAARPYPNRASASASPRFTAERSA